MRSFLATALLLAKAVSGLTPAEWRSQSIYFLLTDRFGRTDNSTTAACDVSQRVCRISFELNGHIADGARSTAEAAGKESSTRYVNLRYQLLHADGVSAGLYPRDGLHCHLDYTGHRPTNPRHW